MEAFKQPIKSNGEKRSYAEVFTGVRQDSGDPVEFAKLISKFYKDQGITEKKSVVFSDSLNVEKCLHYKEVADELGLTPSFGVGTFLTSKLLLGCSYGQVDADCNRRFQEHGDGSKVCPSQHCYQACFSSRKTCHQDK